MVRIKGRRMTAMTISTLAREGAVGVETVRYYQRRHLLPVPPKERGPRVYDETHLRRLRFIRAAQAAGFPLNAIAELVALDATEDRSRALEIARSRIVALDVKIASLEASRDALRKLAERCGHGAAGPCPILEAFAPD